MRLLAILLLGLGVLAIPFVGVYLMGAIGTGGNEAVGELLVVLAVAVIGILGGLGAWRAASAIGRRAV